MIILVKIMPVINNNIKEGALTFNFPVGSWSTKYDDWSFYINHVQKKIGGSKAVDIVYVEDDVTWLIEVKDYRQRKRHKSITLHDEVALKVRDTLAGLVAAKLNSVDPDEKRLASLALKKNKMRVVLHLEQSPGTSRLFPQAVNPANLLMNLKKSVNCIDLRPRVVSRNSLHADMNWTVV